MKSPATIGLDSRLTAAVLFCLLCAGAGRTAVFPSPAAFDPPTCSAAAVTAGESQGRCDSALLAGRGFAPPLATFREHLQTLIALDLLRQQQCTGTADRAVAAPDVAQFRLFGAGAGQTTRSAPTRAMYCSWII